MTSLFSHIDPRKFDGKRVGVAFGGKSEERSISLETGRALVEGLRTFGHKVAEYDLPDDLPQLLSTPPDALLLALHGGFGENGTLQGLLEMVKIPYTGTRVAGSALAMDKHRAKGVLRNSGIDVPDGGHIPAQLFSTLKKLSIDEAIDLVDTELSLSGPLEFPLILKRNSGGSSVGVTLSKTPEEYKANLLKYMDIIDPNNPSDGLLLEGCIQGPEYSVGFYDDLFLGAIEIQPAHEFYDLESKYASKGATKYLHVERGELLGQLEHLGRRAYRALGLSGVARIDIIGERYNFHVLEANTIPGMTPSSLIPMMAKKLGVDFAEFANLILCGARLEAQQ